MELLTSIYIITISGALGSLSKFLTIYLNKKQRHRLSDPLYLILIAISILIAIIILFLDVQWWPMAVAGLAFANWALLRFTDDDYDIGKSVKNAFILAKKCPNCMKELPSQLTSKCPHCTADL